MWSWWILRRKYVADYVFIKAKAFITINFITYWGRIQRHISIGIRTRHMYSKSDLSFGILFTCEWFRIFCTTVYLIKKILLLQIIPYVSQAESGWILILWISGKNMWFSNFFSNTFWLVNIRFSTFRILMKCKRLEILLFMLFMLSSW